MGSRRRKGLADELVTLPWQITAVLALAAFIVVRWVLPLLLPESPVVSGLRPLFGVFSWVALCFFGLIALAGAATRGPAPAMQDNLVILQMPEKSLNDPPLRQQPQPPAPARWSLEPLRALEWKRFELLCARYYQAVGFRTEPLDAGPDGGIDVKLFKIDQSTPLAIVQCKAWNTNQVGVKEIRELLGVMAHTKVTRGIFVTTGTFTKDALAFGAANPIQLLDGAAFEKKIRELPSEKQDALLTFAFEGDYRTPTCASCGVKLVAREGKRGPFWGCRHYPRCKSTLPRRENSA